MKKKIIRRTLLLVLVFIVCSVIAMLILDRVAKSAVQSEGSKALGVAVTLDSMHIGLYKRESNLRGLTIANPEGFISETVPTILTVQDVDMDFGVMSLLGSAIEIPTAFIVGINLNIEQINGASNIESLINNISSKSTSDDSGDGKPFNIGTLTIKDVTVTARGEFTVVDTGPVTAHIDEIVLHDLGAGGGAEVAIEAITTAVTHAILRHLSEHPAEGISKLVVGQVTGLMNELPIIKDLGLGDLTQNITDGLGKEVDNVLEGIGDLLGGGN